MMDNKQLKVQKENELLELVSGFCKKKLNDEYENLCVELVKKLGRKRNVPFMTGKMEIWAATIIYTIGSLNFLFDKSFEPYIHSKEIHEYFGTKSSTVSAKSKLIRDMLNMNRLSNEFSTSRMNDMLSPLFDFVIVDDMIVPLSSIPEEYQKIVKEARANGEDISFRTNQ